MLASEYYSQGNWNQLLLIAVSIDIFSDDLALKEYVERLNKIQSSNIQKINNIQNSISWSYGNLWNDPEQQADVLERVGRQLGLEIISKSKILDLLIKFGS